MKYFIYMLLAVFLCGIVLNSTARDIDQDEALELRQKERILPYQRILNTVLAHYVDARILEVELEEDDDVLTYKMEILTDRDVVRELEIDPYTGNMLSDELED